MGGKADKRRPLAKKKGQQIVPARAGAWRAIALVMGAMQRTDLIGPACYLLSPFGYAVPGSKGETVVHDNNHPSPHQAQAAYPH